MANRRETKKNIRKICGDVIADCILMREFVEGADKDGLYNVMLETVTLRENALGHTSFCYPHAKSDFASVKEFRTDRRKYYRAAYSELVKEFNEKLVEIVKNLNAQLPAEWKEANKSALS